MKKIVVASLVAGASATAAVAGGVGPVIVDTTPVVVPESPSSSLGGTPVIAALVGLVVIGAVLSGSH